MESKAIACGNCKQKHTSIQEVRDCFGTKMVEHTNLAPRPISKVIVTCGWGKDAHKWETTKAEAIANRSMCEQHRG